MKTTLGYFAHRNLMMVVAAEVGGGGRPPVPRCWPEIRAFYLDLEALADLASAVTDAVRLQQPRRFSLLHALHSLVEECCGVHQNLGPDEAVSVSPPQSPSWKMEAATWTPNKKFAAAAAKQKKAAAAAAAATQTHHHHHRQYYFVDAGDDEEAGADSIVAPLIQALFDEVTDLVVLLLFLSVTGWVGGWVVGTWDDTIHKIRDGACLLSNCPFICKNSQI